MTRSSSFWAIIPSGAYVLISYCTTPQYVDKSSSLRLDFEDFDERRLGTRRADRPAPSPTCTKNCKNDMPLPSDIFSWWNVAATHSCMLPSSELGHKFQYHDRIRSINRPRLKLSQYVTGVRSDVFRHIILFPVREGVLKIIIIFSKRLGNRLKWFKPWFTVLI